MRGHRMLTVKSSVEVVNDTAVPLLLSVAGAGRRGGGETLRVPPHESLPLPLRWTERGSDAACLELALRPETSHQWSHLVTLTAETALLTCAPAHAASRARLIGLDDEVHEAFGSWVRHRGVGFVEDLATDLAADLDAAGDSERTQIINAIGEFQAEDSGVGRAAPGGDER